MPASEQRPAARRRAPRRRRRLALSAIACGAALLLATGLGLAFTSPSAPAQSGEELKLDLSVRFLQDVQFRDGCFPMWAGGKPDPVSASPWTALALAGAGVNPREQFRPDGYASVFDCIAKAADQLTTTTDWERTLLVVNAACSDPHDFAGIDLVAKILATQRDRGAFTREPDRPGLSSPVNTTIFAILALAPIDEPAVRRAIRAAADWLLTAQRQEGSWPSTDPASRVGNTDMTGAALEALHAAGALDQDAGRDARDRAVAWLRSIQRDDGGFPDPATVGYGNSASTAWIAQGLWAIGEDPGRWVRGARSMLNFLASLQRPDGAIWWTAKESSNPVWMTSYTLPAYSGRYRPVLCVPYGGRVPDPANAPAPQTPPGGGGTGGGDGGTGGGSGGGVLAGGGGRGARKFSRPRQGSKGSAVGGVRDTEEVRAARDRRHRPRSQQEQDRDPASSRSIGDPRAGRRTRPRADGSASDVPAPDPARPPDGGGAAVDTGARARDGGRHGNTGARGFLGGDGANADRRGAGDGEQISGVVVGGEGAAGQGDSALAAAYGLRSASRGGDSGPWLATGIAGALLLSVGAGGLFERRRPDLEHFA